MSAARAPKRPRVKGRRSVPLVRCTDAAFIYRDSAHTDIRATFERVRAQQAAPDSKAKVQPITKKRSAA